MLSFSRLMTLLFVVFFSAAVAQAQATRTWVSGVGDDANPCSRTAPCKTFAGAISKTSAGGEINALDPGGFGAVTITKPITIDGGPGISGVLVSGTNGIVVSAAATDVITLRNLDIDGVGTGLNGIRFISGAGLYVENVKIYGFTQNGIDFEPTNAASLSVVNVMVRDAASSCLLVKPGVAGSALATVTGSHFDHCTAGVRAEDRSAVVARGSVASANTNNGFGVLATSAPVELDLEGCVSANNANNGLIAVGPGATITISNSTSTHNAFGVRTSAGGAVVSFGNNRIISNTTNGSPTSVVSQQ